MTGQRNRPQSNTITPGSVNAHLAACFQMIGQWANALQGGADLGRAADLLFRILPVSSLRLYRAYDNESLVKRIFNRDTTGELPLTRTMRPQADYQTLGEMGRAQFLHTDQGTTIAIVMGRLRSQTDVLELALSGPLSEHQINLLSLLAQALSDNWMARQPGLISRFIVEQTRRNRPKAEVSDDTAILDYSNPYALSRSEFRVCAMLGEGLTAKRIARELQLSEATIRSHQRNIYAKTKMSGQIEVMFHLQAHPAAGATNGLLPTAAVC